MTTFSLVLATYIRVEPLEQLFASIAEQTGVKIELIVVDQNSDDRLRPLLERWHSKIAIKVVHAAPQLSRARNQGIDAATGDILAFPDDDCWYSAGLFEKVKDFFQHHQEYDMLSVRILDKDNVPSGNRWFQAECEIADINVFRTSVTNGAFFRLSNPRMKAIRFDEGIGPNSGTIFGCGEDTDFMLAAMRAGVRGYFMRNLTIHHPRKDMLSGNIGESRAVDYGRGTGHVLAKYGMKALCLGFRAYDTARAFLCLLRGQRTAARLCMAHARGMREGYRATPATAAS